MMLLIGISNGIVAYNLIHSFSHSESDTSIGLIKKIKLHHLRHHYIDQRTRFGITCPIWDYVFGTMPK